ncbi:unnamed protein product [Boreogadus saida]
MFNIVSYERILSIESLNDVANPWKGFTMNRCIAVALLVVLVSSSMNELHEAVDYVYEETYQGVLYVGGLEGSKGSLWSSVLGWWGTEEVGVIRRRKRPISGRVVLRPRTKE